MKVILHIDSVEDGTFGVDLSWVSSGILTLEDFKQITIDIVQSDLPRDLPYDTPVLWDMDSHEVFVADKPDPYCLKCNGRGVGNLSRRGHCPECYKWDHLSPFQDFTGVVLFYNKGYWD